MVIFSLLSTSAIVFSLPSHLAAIWQPSYHHPMGWWERGRPHQRGANGVRTGRRSAPNPAERMADHDAGQRGGRSPRQAMALNDSASALSAVDPTAPIDWVVNT